jgi:hypothetical protein
MLLLAGALSGGTAFSQAVSATILGSVKDATGAVVANAKVMLTETNTGVDRPGVTNASGTFTYANMPPGVYRVTVEVPGFKKEVRNAIGVAVDTTSRVDVVLSPGNVTETVNVTAEAAIMKTDTADISSMIDATQIQELPNLFNGNYQLMLSLVPGVSEPTEQHSQFFNASGSVQMNTFGQPRHANNYQTEGIDNNERTGLLQIMIPPKEAIQQVNVSTSNHDPELGRGTGAVSNVVLKSGSNQIHGGMYWNLQNSLLSTRSFFNPAVGHVAYNQVGGNIGGPIKKNKLFYFTDYLKTMDHEGNTNQTSVPSMDYRAGDFSIDKTHLVYDPFSADMKTNNGVGRTAFPDNIIPPSRIDPIAKKIFALMPPPNNNLNTSNGLTQTNNYFALLPFTKTTDHVDAKVDYQASDKDRYAVRFSWEKPVIYQASMYGDAGGPAQGAFQGTGVQRTYATGLNYDRTISPTLITQVRIGIAYYNNVAQQTDYGKNTSEALGIPGVNINDFTSGMVTVNLGGYSTPLVGYSASLPWVRAETNIDLVNSWTKLTHKHTIKFGVNYRRLRDALLQDQTFSPRGRYTFGAFQTSISGSSGGTSINNDVASMLLGVPSDVARDVNTYFPSLRATQIFSFIADQWQVSPRLTASIGLRWELYKPMTPEHAGGFSNYIPTDDTLVIAGVGSNPSDLGMNFYKRYFAPRMGLAYRLRQDPKWATVIRTGFGMSYSPFSDNTYAYNYPVRSNNEYVTTGGNNYTGVFLPDGRPATFANGLPAPYAVAIPTDGIIHSPDKTQSYTYIPKDFKNPYVIQWNFAIQQALPFHLNLDVAYVGSKGVDTPASVNLNPGLVFGAGSAGQPYFQKFGRAVAETQYYQGFSSTYHSLQVKFDRRFTSGLTMTSAFTWQKAMGFQGGDNGGLARWYINPRRNYARMDFDRTLNFVQSYVYRLPVGKGQKFASHGIAAAIFGGWQGSGILTLRTGAPLTFTDGAGAVAVNATGNTQTPDQVGEINVLHGINIGNPWFDRSSFARTNPGQFGNMGRAVWSGPGQFRLDAGVSRWITFNERWKAQVRADSYNVTNTSFFSNPNLDRNSVNFGYITGTVGSGSGVNGFSSSRSVQFALKIVF